MYGGETNSLPFLWGNGENMKKNILFVLSLCFIFALVNFCFAGEMSKSGEYYRYIEDGGTVAYDKIVEVDRNKYYVNSDGYVVFNSWVEKDGKYFYAGKEGKFYLDGVYDIEGYKYYLDTDGVMQKGWCCDYTYYGDLEDGYLVNGFQELEVPSDFITEEMREKIAWFYFDTNTYKRVFSNDLPYMTKTIGGRRYCFDQNGILRTGWRMIKETTPIMKGYMYFVEDTTDEFKFGEAVTNTWYAVEPPNDVLPGMDVRYFYFNGQGQPRTAQQGRYSKVRLGDKTFLFNEYGYAVYGVRAVDDDYYYFGPSVQDCSMKIGLINRDIDGSEDGSTFYFEDDGRGFTGVKNNKLYYKGKIQRAESEQRYAGVQVKNLVYLVNSAGVVQKNKRKVKDADGCEWSTNSSGIVTHKSDEADYTEAKPPELTSDE